MVTEARPFLRHDSLNQRIAIRNSYQGSYDWPRAKIENLTEDQIEAYKWKAMGYEKPQIVELIKKSASTVRGIFVHGLDRSEGLHHMFAIEALIEAGKIKQAEISKAFDFDRYDLLEGKTFKVFSYVTHHDHWIEDQKESARNLGLSKKTLTRHLTIIYNTLGVPNITAARVFALLRARERTPGGHNP